jgi:hypothetical protein
VAVFKKRLDCFRNITLAKKCFELKDTTAKSQCLINENETTE